MSASNGTGFDLGEKFNNYSREQLLAMSAAGEQIRDCYRLLQKDEQHGNVVREVLKDQGTFYEFEHYPTGDVQDTETHGQYFYHAHRGLNGENGHFHTFLRNAGMPDEVGPIPYDGDAEWPEGDNALSHLVSISMDKKGYPIGLFTTNRWVTGECWYPAEDVILMLDRFEMDLLYPSWPVNIWITAMMRLFRPQIESLLLQRDAMVKQWQTQQPGVDVFENRDLEVTSQMLVSVEDQLTVIGQVLGSSSHT